MTQYPFDPEEYDYWMPVDTYTGGIEHATMHLIYTVSTKPARPGYHPQRRAHDATPQPGMVLGGP